MKLKKLSAIFLSFATIIGLIPNFGSEQPVSAETKTDSSYSEEYTKYEGVDETKMNVIGGRVYAQPGEEVAYPVYAYKNPGFAASGIRLIIDNRLEPIMKGEKLKFTTGPAYDSISVAGSYNSEANIFGIGSIGMEIEKDDGLMFCIYVKVPETAQPGDTFQINVDVEKILDNKAIKLDSKSLYGWIAVPGGKTPPTTQKLTTPPSTTTTTTTPAPIKPYDDVDTTNFSIVGGRVNAQPGEIVEYPVHVYRNPGFDDLYLLLNYPEGIEPVMDGDKPKSKIVMKGVEEIYGYSAYNEKARQLTFWAFNNSNEQKDGIVFYYYFKVPETAQPGDNFKIDLSNTLVYKLKDSSDVTSELIPLDRSILNGWITIPGSKTTTTTKKVTTTTKTTTTTTKKATTTTKPATTTTKKVTTTTKPATTTTKKVTTTTKPATTTTKKVTTTTKPATTTTKKVTTTTKPAATTTKKVTTTTKPATTTTKKVTTTTKPATTTTKKVTTTTKPATTTKKVTTTTKPVTTKPILTTSTPIKPPANIDNNSYTKYDGIVKDKINIICGRIYAQPGEEAVYPIYIHNNKGYAGIGAFMNYDENLTPTFDGNDVKLAYGPAAGNTLSAASCNTKLRRVTFSTLSEKNRTEDGILCWTYFKVPETAKPGDTFKISLTVDELVNVDYQNVEFNSLDGWIKIADNGTTTTAPQIKKIKKTIAGDANCDDTVDIADVVAIKYYLLNSKKYSLSEQGTANADVQGNGNGINLNDAVMIQQYCLKLIDRFGA